MRHSGFFGGGGGFVAGTAAPVTVGWAWVGNVSSDAATIKMRSTDAASMTLRYSTSPTLATYQTATGSEGSDDVWTFELDGLDPLTRYYYRAAGSDVVGTFRTFPTGAASFTVAAASCAGHVPNSQNPCDYPGPGQTSNSPAFARITDRDPLLFIHMGDRGYPDIATNSPSAFRTNYNNNMANARQLAMHLAMPVAYHWSDHDFGPNDAVGSSASKPAAQQVYREHVPHWTLPDDEAIYQSFAVGRVRFFLLDVHSERSANNATDNSSKTMLGATQKQWLKDELLAATEKVLVIGINTPWMSSGAAWPQYSTERQELAEFFEDNDLTERIVLLQADWHWVAADDGTNSQFDPGSTDPGPVVLSFAPLDAAFTVAGGTYSEGIHTESMQQYGTMAFADEGATITLTATGWAVDDEDETEILELVHVFDAT